MSNFARHFDASKFDMDTNTFRDERDTSRAIFYMADDVDADGNLIQVEMVKIVAPGEQLNVYGGKVREDDRLRFAREYDAFKKGEELMVGTPLSKWPAVAGNVEFLSQMRAYGFQTVEDMAKMADSAQRLFHGSLTWKKRAQAFLDLQAKTDKADEVSKLRDDTARENAELKQQLADMQAAIAQMNERKKPGPKPKADVAA